MSFCFVVRLENLHSPSAPSLVVAVINKICICFKFIILYPFTIKKRNCSFSKILYIGGREHTTCGESLPFKVWSASFVVWIGRSVQYLVERFILEVFQTTVFILQHKCWIPAWIFCISIFLLNSIMFIFWNWLTGVLCYLGLYKKSGKLLLLGLEKQGKCGRITSLMLIIDDCWWWPHSCCHAGSNHITFSYESLACSTTLAPGDRI